MQRWGRSRSAPAQKRDAVLAVLTKRKTVSAVCSELQVSETGFNRWREQALQAIDEAMEDKPIAARQTSTLSAVSPRPSVPSDGSPWRTKSWEMRRGG